MENQQTGATSRELVITKVFKAPRELVFHAFTQAEHLAHWWGPAGFELKVHQLDVRPGGLFHYSMAAQNGHMMYGLFVYHEVKAPERITFVSSFADEHGDIIPPPFPDPWPQEIMNIWTFEEEDGQTVLTLRGWAHHATEEEQQTFNAGFTSMQQGFSGTFAKLETYLATL